MLPPEEVTDLMRSTGFWEDIDELVQAGRMDRTGLPYGRPPWGSIARESARLWRELRRKDPNLPKLVIDDFREYLRDTYTGFDL